MTPAPDLILIASLFPLVLFVSLIVAMSGDDIWKPISKRNRFMTGLTWCIIGAACSIIAAFWAARAVDIRTQGAKAERFFDAE